MNKKIELWNRCDYCGIIISYADFDDKIASRYLLTPDTQFTAETYATHHVKCKTNSIKRRTVEYEY